MFKYSAYERQMAAINTDVYLKSKKITQLDLANKMGMSEQMLINLLNNSVGCPDVAIAKGLKLPSFGKITTEYNRDKRWLASVKIASKKVNEIRDKFRLSNQTMGSLFGVKENIISMIGTRNDKVAQNYIDTINDTDVSAILAEIKGMNYAQRANHIDSSSIKKARNNDIFNRFTNHKRQRART